MQIKVVRQILEWNEDCHKEVQEELGNKNVKMINIMGSPGAGKTTFILNLIEELKSKDLRVGVIEGDIEGTIGLEYVFFFIKKNGLVGARNYPYLSPSP